MAVTTNTVLYEKRGQVAHVTLNRPDSMNALNRELQRGLAEAWMEIRDDPDVLVGIVTGAGGRAFSAGMDLKERAAEQTNGAPLTPMQTVWGVEQWKPVIAAIDGYRVAGGLEVALYCDIRIATEQSQFGLPEPRWSLLAGYGLHHLNRMVPLGEALYLQVTGSRITAQEAHRIGLIHSVHPNRDALTEAAEKIASDVLLCAPLAVQAIKRIVMTGRNLPVEYSYKLARDIGQQIGATEDAKEGPRAFAERRQPQWKMR